MKRIKEYRYALFISLYGVVYMFVFRCLEQRRNVTYHTIHCALDDKIPFCEYFAIPYLLWFFYIFATVFYFVIINRNETDCRRLLTMLCSGMTLFLLISFCYPNGLHLRPLHLQDRNFFTHLVLLLYQTDTPTNVFPSIHVFNSMAVYFAITNCRQLTKHRLLCNGVLLLTILIVLSTLFLKQHSVIDVVFGMLLAFALYVLCYQKVPLRQSRQLEQKI